MAAGIAARRVRRRISTRGQSVRNGIRSGHSMMTTASLRARRVSTRARATSRSWEGFVDVDRGHGMTLHGCWLCFESRKTVVCAETWT